MRPSSVMDRGLPVLPSKRVDTAGFHRCSLSLAGQTGCSGDGAGVRPGGKHPIVLQFATWVHVFLCPNQSRPKLDPLGCGLGLIEASGDVVMIFIFPSILSLSFGGWFWLG